MGRLADVVGSWDGGTVGRMCGGCGGCGGRLVGDFLDVADVVGVVGGGFLCPLGVFLLGA